MKISEIVDRAGEVKAEIDNLTKEFDVLRGKIKAYAEDKNKNVVRGKTYTATFTDSVRSEIDEAAFFDFICRNNKLDMIHLITKFQITSIKKWFDNEELNEFMRSNLIERFFMHITQNTR